MSEMSISSGTDTTRRRPGRRHKYGVPTVQGTVNYPPALIERLRNEVVWRNARAGDPEAWAVSSLVVDILLAHFEMTANGGE